MMTPEMNEAAGIALSYAWCVLFHKSTTNKSANT